MLSGRVSERGIPRSNGRFLIPYGKIFSLCQDEKTSFSISLPSTKLTIFVNLFTNLVL